MRKNIQQSLVILSMAYLITGCASLFSQQSQPITIKPQSGSQVSANVQCYVQNGRGSWMANVGESTFILRDNKMLQVNCYNEDHVLVGKTSIEPYYNKTNLWNIPLTLIPIAGIAGWIYDWTDGTTSEYPATVNVSMNNTVAK